MVCKTIVEGLDRQWFARLVEGPDRQWFARLVEDLGRQWFTRLVEGLDRQWLFSILPVRFFTCTVLGSVGLLSVESSTESDFFWVNLPWVIHGKRLSHLFQGSFM